MKKRSRQEIFTAATNWAAQKTESRRVAILAITAVRAERASLLARRALIGHTDEELSNVSNHLSGQISEADKQIAEQRSAGVTAIDFTNLDATHAVLRVVLEEQKRRGDIPTAPAPDIQP